MKKLMLSALLACVVVAPANADQKEKCKVLADPTATTSRSMSKLYVSMQGLDFRAIAQEFTGEERAHMLELSDIQAELLPLFEKYVYEIETLALMMSRCSR